MMNAYGQIGPLAMGPDKVLLAARSLTTNDKAIGRSATLGKPAVIESAEAESLSKVAHMGRGLAGAGSVAEHGRNQEVSG